MSDKTSVDRRLRPVATYLALWAVVSVIVVVVWASTAGAQESYRGSLPVAPSGMVVAGDAFSPVAVGFVELQGSGPLDVFADRACDRRVASNTYDIDGLETPGPQVVHQAVGDKKGIRRYGHAYVPLDEALSRVVIDFSGRPGLVMDVPFKSGMIGSFDSQLVHEFFQGFVNHAFVTLHIDNLKGENAHHQAETVFKAFARALRSALELDPRSVGQIPSTKGSL